MTTQLVWFKRDLRIDDHAALAAAARRGPVVGLYAYEPEVVQATDFDAQHLAFIDQALAELEQQMLARGAVLIYRAGSMPGVLGALHAELGFDAIWAHEETGNAITYARDRRVRAWARQHGIAFNEMPHAGVIRRLASRDGWAQHWQQVMRAPIVPAPERFAAAPALLRGSRPAAAALGVRSAAERVHHMLGGASVAHTLLSTFLETRGVGYRIEMSSPVTAFDACSRLSPHFAFGTMSTRQAWQAARDRHRTVDRDPSPDPRWKGAIASFTSRLAWRDHFMQKLESEPRIEFENFARAYDALRPREADPVRLEAWITGNTGYPFIDACMRALRAEGWLNFRMRAMLVSFASYHLWLDWRATAKALAPHFLDYEPGIHYSQFQMQSGTTGINTARIYNPYKQGIDQDPSGAFIRRWVPELESLPPDAIHSPHEMPLMLQQMSGVVIGRDYPPPIVDHATAYRDAKDRLFTVRRSAAAQREASVVLERHGSRSTPGQRRRP